MRLSRKKSIILLSVDDPDEQFIFTTALNEGNRTFEIFSFHTAKELLAHLHHLSCFCSDRHLLNFTVLAELKLPFFDWRDIAAIRALPKCEDLAIHVFAETHLQICPIHAKKRGASGFYNKPHSLTEFRDLLNELLSKTEAPQTLSTTISSTHYS